MVCRDCQVKEKTIAKLKRLLEKARICDEEKYHRIKGLEAMIKNLPNKLIHPTNCG